MALKYINAEVRMSELFTTNVCVPAWELPLLRALHGDAVKVIDDSVTVKRDPPEAPDEFRRLVTRYRDSKTEDGGRGIPVVASVYGQFGVGTEALRRAIAEATIEDAASGLLGTPRRRQGSSVGG